ncbi:MAG: hypothetical protein ACRD8U_04515, partial [Pyrinomonadaceae bacterium]
EDPPEGEGVAQASPLLQLNIMFGEDSNQDMAHHLKGDVIGETPISETLEERINFILHRLFDHGEKFIK